MKAARLAVVIASLCTAGCAISGNSASTPTATTERNSTPSANAPSAAVAPASDGHATPPGASHADDPRVTLEPFRVHEWPFTDFGMSIKTNFGVTVGETVQWMEISALEPDSSAARARLFVGDRLLAIGGTLVTKLDRATMLEALFQRKKGEQVRFLVQGRQDALPHFVTLTAGSR